uniref:Uncharacterized protein n=1 Tax=Brassica oleracea TaxID=3712 RepID=A0A3P6E2V3_BRAOL|nr:unnamed protein product [Brassica oleracea]
MYVTKTNNLVSMFNNSTTLSGSLVVYQNIYDLFRDMVVNPMQSPINMVLLYQTKHAEVARYI